MKHYIKTSGDKTIIIQLDYTNSDFNFLLMKTKMLDGRRWNNQDKHWSAPKTENNIRKIADMLSGYSLEQLTSLFEVDIEIMYQVSEMLKTMKELSEKSKAADVAVGEFVIPKTLNHELRPFQKAGIMYAVKTKKTFIADEMGLGKTIQAIGAAEYLEASKILIICPATIKINWSKEILSWTNHQAIILNGGKIKDQPDNFKYCIINYDILSKWSEFLYKQNWDMLIIDESHYVKNYKAQRTKWIENFTDQKNMNYVFLLTGTPILNRPVELMSQLKIIKRLDEFGGFWNFVKKYCDAKKEKFGWNFSGASNTDELNDQLRQRCYIRRNKKDVLKELPDKQRTDVELSIDNRTEYDVAKKSFISWLKDNVYKDDEFMKSLEGMSDEDRNKQIQMKRSALSNKAERAEALVKIEYLKQLCVKGKMNSAIEWINDFLESGEKLVLFCTHRETIKSIMNIFPEAVTINGSQSSSQRQESIEKFQNDPSVNLIVCSIKAAGVGITLTKSSNVAFLEFGWTPADHDQAEDRVHRIGQKNSVNVYYLAANDTIDDDVLDLINMKREIVTSVTDGKGGSDVSIFNQLINRIVGDDSVRNYYDMSADEKIQIGEDEIPF